MQIQDFIPYYPPIGEHLQTDIVKQKEFYELASGRLTKDFLRAHQTIIARFLSKHTIYNSILLYHQPGTGKTCASIAAIEHNRTSEYKRAVILTPSNTLKKQYKNQVMYECMPHKPKNMTFYNFFTFCTFPGFNDRSIQKFENSIFVIDEVHKLKHTPHSHVIELFNIINSQSNPYIFTLGDKVRFTYKRIPLLQKTIVLTDPAKQTIRIKKTLLPDETEVPETTIFIRMRRSPYDNILYLLSRLKHKKIILMSGTPMTDNAREFANIINLLNPDRTPITESTFQKSVQTNEFPANIKALLYGKISYLMSNDEDVNVVYKTNPAIPDIQLTTDNKQFVPLYFLPLGTNQNASYKAVKDIAINPKDQGSGFKNQIRLSKISVAVGNITKANVQTDSCKFYNILNIIQTNNNPRYNRHFIYCEFVKDGVQKLQSFLELYFPKSDITVIQYGKAQTTIASRTGSSQSTEDKIKAFNENTDFTKPKIIISSKMISEGVTIKNISHVHITTPHWNMAVIDQAVARGIRFKSHELLKQKFPDFKVTVNLYLYVALFYDSDMPQPFDSIDYQKYSTSFQKDIQIKRVEKLLQDIAFDCNLHSDRNTVLNPENKHFTRDCYYERCAPPTCMKSININDITPDQLETSSYNLYYSDYQAHYVQILEWIRDNIKDIPMFTISQIPTNANPFTIKNVLHNIIYNQVPIHTSFTLQQSSGVFYISPHIISNPTPIHTILYNTPIATKPPVKNIPIPNVNPIRLITPTEKQTLNNLKKTASADKPYAVFISQTQPVTSNVSPFLQIGKTTYGIVKEYSITTNIPTYGTLYGNLYVSTSKISPGAGRLYRRDDAQTLLQTILDSQRLIVLKKT